MTFAAWTNNILRYLLPRFDIRPSIVLPPVLYCLGNSPTQAQGRMTAVTAANVLGLSRQQVHRLLKSFQTEGPAAIRHKARGRRSNNSIDPAVLEFAVTLVKENYIDFGPTFAAEKLA